MNDEEILNKFKTIVAINNFKSSKCALPEKIIWRENQMRKKLIIITCSFLILISGVVIANYNKIISKFGLGEGVESAVKNGYIANTEMNYLDSNATATDKSSSITLNNINLNTKIEDFMMDDLTIGTHFVFEIDKKINEVINIDDINNIELKDLVITDEEKRILYCEDKDAFEKYCKSNNLNYKFNEYNENYYNCGMNCFMTYHNKETGTINFTYNIYVTDSIFPRSKKINFNFAEVLLQKHTQEKEEYKNVSLTGNWSISFNVPKEMYNRKSISYKVTSCENPDFQVTNATLTNTGFELGIIISNIEKPTKPEILKDYYDIYTAGEDKALYVNNDVKITDEKKAKEIKEALEQYNKKLYPIEVRNKNIEKTTYIENAKGEKFTCTMNSARKQDCTFIDGNKFSFYETFSLTTYNATNKIKAIIMYEDKPYVINLERVK